MKKVYKQEVIKIQKPMFSSGSINALIYNEDHSLITILPWTKEMDAAFGDDVKQYWLAGIPQFKGYIELIEQVEEQDW